MIHQWNFPVYDRYEGLSVLHKNFKEHIAIKFWALRVIQGQIEFNAENLNIISHFPKENVPDCYIFKL